MAALACKHILVFVTLIKILTDAPFAYSQNLTTGGSATTKAPTTTPATTQAPQTLPESTSLPENTDLGTCVCDLTGNSCDVNCCCDPDCTADDRNTFSQCIETTFETDDKVCLQSYQVITENTPYTVERTDTGLFCIEYDNYEARNYFVIPDSVLTIDKYQELYGQYSSYSYQSTSEEDIIYADFYQSGDPIYTLYETLALGRLGVSSPLVTDLCEDNNPAAYLFDETFDCTRDISDLAAQCQSLPSLSLAIYYQNFKVISTPAFLQQLNSTVLVTNATTESPTTQPPPINATDSTTLEPSTAAPSLYQDSRLINVSLASLQCYVSGLNLTVDCSQLTDDDLPSPLYNATTSTCDYAVMEVAYSVVHNGSDGIKEVGVSFILGSISESSLPWKQKFTVVYSKVDESEVFVRSGNPGYVLGEPLLAGTLTEQTDDTGAISYSINLSSDRNNWLSVVSSTAAGDCVNDTDSRVPVTFGYNTRTGCLLRVSLEDITEGGDYCELLQGEVLAALLGPDPPDRVAMFGNSQVEVVGDWVTILDSGLSNTPIMSSSGECRSIVLSLNIEVIYANVGSLANPQPKVIGVRFNYGSTTDLSYQCVGRYCQPEADSLTQAFEVVSAVTFVEASSYPDGIIAEPPSFEAKLPSDFFYPFSKSDRITWSAALTALCLFASLL